MRGIGSGVFSGRGAAGSRLPVGQAPPVARRGRGRAWAGVFLPPLRPGRLSLRRRPGDAGRGEEPGRAGRSRRGSQGRRRGQGGERSRPRGRLRGPEAGEHQARVGSGRRRPRVALDHARGGGCAGVVPGRLRWPPRPVPGHDRRRADRRRRRGGMGGAAGSLPGVRRSCGRRGGGVGRRRWGGGGRGSSGGRRTRLREPPAKCSSGGPAEPGRGADARRPRLRRAGQVQPSVSVRPRRRVRPAVIQPVGDAPEGRREAATPSEPSHRPTRVCRRTG